MKNPCLRRTDHQLTKPWDSDSPGMIYQEVATVLSEVYRDLPIAGNLAIWHIVHMDREQIIAKLREHAPELKAVSVA
jgi:hypothetical protein